MKGKSGRHYKPIQNAPRLWSLLAAAGALGLALLVFVLLRGNRQAMDVLYLGFAAPWYRFTGWAAGFVPFSVAELLCILLVLACLFFICKAVRDMVRAPSLRLFMQKILIACVAVLTVSTGISYLWGVCYYSTPFEEKAGIAAAPVSVKALGDTAALYAALVNECAPLTRRNPDGTLDADRAALLAASKTLYGPMEAAYPFLKGISVPAKPLLLSEGMSAINYTGIFIPFTGEANVNDRAPLCLFPATIAHELAHARGVGPEQTANFVGILACSLSDNPNYAYSGALLGYLHLSNALYDADRDRWRETSATLCPEAKADFTQSNAYWARYDSPAAQAADAVYESFLQGYSQDMGLKSYGAVVDLLVGYYQKASL